MPLKAGKGSFSANISELMSAYEKKGSIGNSNPKSRSAAFKQALAIAFRKARETRKSYMR